MSDNGITRGGRLTKVQTIDLCIWYHIHKVLGSQLINLQTYSTVVESHYQFLPGSDLEIEIGWHIVGRFCGQSNTSTCLALCHQVSCSSILIKPN